MAKGKTRLQALTWLWGGNRPGLITVKERNYFDIMNRWGDAKRFLAEDIAVYTGVILIDVFLDVICNFFITVGIVSDLSKGDGHPFTFGLYQTMVLVFALGQLVRKVIDYRYYA